MHKIFIRIHRFVEKNRALTLFLALAYLGLTVFLFTRLQFEEDITRLIPKSESSDRASRVLNSLEFADKITVLIRKDKEGNTDDLTAMADAFLDSLTVCEPYVRSVQGRLSEDTFEEAFAFVRSHLPLFLDASDYSVLEARLRPDSLRATVQANYRMLTSPSALVSGRMVMEDPLGMTFTGLRKLQDLNAGEEFVTENGYVLTPDRQNLLLFINPVLAGNETEKNTAFAEQLYRIQNHLNREFETKSTVEYYGAALIAVANARQIKQDIVTTTAVALAVLMLILMLYYRRFYVPLLLFIPTVFGVLMATTALYFLKDTISAISLSIGAILLGVTIDYALHILTHYKHNSDMETLYRDVTRPLIMSSTTTAVAFLCLLFVHSEALRDLGIFAAVAVVASALFSLLIIPHLYRQRPQETPRKKNLLDRLSAYSFERSRLLIALCVLAIVISLFTYSKVGFNEDISRLNFVPEDIRQTEKKLEESTHLTSKSLYLVNYAGSLDSALDRSRTLAAELRNAKTAGLILDFSSPADLLLSQAGQQQKTDRWNRFWTPQRKALVEQTLVSEGLKTGLAADAYASFFELLNHDFHPVSYTGFLDFEALSLQDFISDKGGLFSVISQVKIDESRRDEVLARFKNEPSTLVIDRQQLNETFLGNLKNDFNSLVNLSFIAVLLILFVFFRRVELVLISAIPIGLTGLVTAGVMGLLGIDLNIFSTIVCTLVFGHGVDFSIFMTSALQKEYTYGRDEMPLYRTSVLLAVLTTILAIGALIFAEHPALKSISAVSLVGVSMAVLITFVFYPLLFRAFIMWRPKRGKSPARLLTLITSVLSFTYYGLGGLFFSFLSTLASFWPGNRERLKSGLRRFMAAFMKSVLDTSVNLRKTRIVNTTGEDFRKPAVIIANHTSFLDILALGMLHPRTVFLVSDWVYNSPIFGKGVRFLGFYPVSKGLEGGMDQLKEKVDAGYSIIVFPEGTRSPDNRIRRFHKGAFYLAEHFGMDILPVLIHGGADVFPKGDFFIRKYGITLKILERISPENRAFGEGYRERTKGVSRYFKEEYSRLRQELEGPGYFGQVVMENYLYKEEEVYEAVKTGLEEKEKRFFAVEPELSSTARILHIADDYGEGDLLMVLREPARKVDSWIRDEEKREVARNNYMVRNRHLDYPGELPVQGNYDVLLISCAHRLPEEWVRSFTQVIDLKSYV
ncbi:1-acyl-sn-glycerol-3-phosphate acyltransferase [Leadbetterella sp. DM7]|uniref:1-acyl-sn-glycerol-3-phosphate acyltransferase n=1 Tax=Leadbetterella sp. DM7 TaxID=3235085 RepID=UPI00349EFF54